MDGPAAGWIGGLSLVAFVLLGSETLFGGAVAVVLLGAVAWGLKGRDIFGGTN